MGTVVPCCGGPVSEIFGRSGPQITQFGFNGLFRGALAWYARDHLIIGVGNCINLGCYILQPPSVTIIGVSVSVDAGAHREERVNLLLDGLGKRQIVIQCPTNVFEIT